MITANAYAKINWSLSICGTRPDGYHALDMLMQRISLHDVLTFEISDSLSLTIDGTELPADDDNLVLKAARALNDYCGTCYGALITLEKHIPARAGLGGGSADCACTLINLNHLWKLGLSQNDLDLIGIKLGADVPYCLRKCLCRAEGIGEILTPISSAPHVHLALVTPGDGLSTPQVFRRWNDGGYPETFIDNIALADALYRADYSAVKNLSHNDLEAPAIDLMPEIRTYMDTFQSLGAKFVRMTGSGSTVFAVFESRSLAENAVSAVKGAVYAQTITGCENA